MPKIVLHRNGQVHEGEVKENSNLVVRAGIREFPYPILRFQCGMGKCATCACRVLAGAEHLPPPNWKRRSNWATPRARLPADLPVVDQSRSGIGAGRHAAAASDGPHRRREQHVFAILTSKPGQFRTELSDGLTPVEA